MVHSYALKLDKGSPLVPRDREAVERLKEMPPNWALDHDEDLASFLSSHLEVDNENLGSIKNYVESIDVSSNCVSGFSFRNISSVDSRYLTRLQCQPVCHSLGNRSHGFTRSIGLSDRSVR